MARDRHEREQDRADLLAALTEALEAEPIDPPLRWQGYEHGQMSTSHLVAAARGCHLASVWRYAAAAMVDLRALERAGLVVSYAPHPRYELRWRLGSSVDQDANEDHADVRRSMDGWEPA